MPQVHIKVYKVQSTKFKIPLQLLTSICGQSFAIMLLAKDILIYTWDGMVVATNFTKFYYCVLNSSLLFVSFVKVGNDRECDIGIILN